jgi:hypothetical protein
MNNKNTSQNKLSNSIYESNSNNLTQIESDTCVPVTHSNNVATSDQELISNVILNDNIIPLDYNYQKHDVSNTIPNHNYWQSTSNNALPSQFYPQYINNQNPPNPPQFNIFPPLNSFNITINSPQTNIIIIPATNPDINIKFETSYNSQT